jgi:hypothetical protein
VVITRAGQCNRLQLADCFGTQVRLVPDSDQRLLQPEELAGEFAISAAGGRPGELLELVDEVVGNDESAGWIPQFCDPSKWSLGDGIRMHRTSGVPNVVQPRAYCIVDGCPHRICAPPPDARHLHPDGDTRCGEGGDYRFRIGRRRLSPSPRSHRPRRLARELFGVGCTNSIACPNLPVCREN